MQENGQRGFFREDEKSSENLCNWNFFAATGVFCSKLLVSVQKHFRKNFLKLLSKNLFITPLQKIDGPKSRQILVINVFDDVCRMCAHTVTALD